MYIYSSNKEQECGTILEYFHFPLLYAPAQLDFRGKHLTLMTLVTVDELNPPPVYRSWLGL